MVTLCLIGPELSILCSLPFTLSSLPEWAFTTSRGFKGGQVTVGISPRQLLKRPPSGEQIVPQGTLHPWRPLHAKFSPDVSPKCLLKSEFAAAAWNATLCSKDVFAEVQPLCGEDQWVATSTFIFSKQLPMPSCSFGVLVLIVASIRSGQNAGSLTPRWQL